MDLMKEILGWNGKKKNYPQMAVFAVFRCKVYGAEDKRLYFKKWKLYSGIPSKH